jgi:UPF0716 protein FxsA
MFLPLLLLFTLVPVIELSLIFKVHAIFSSMYGSDRAVGISILVIILTGYFGAKLAKSQGLKLFSELQTKLQSGQVPNLELVEGLLVLFGGLMLLTPGYVTDTVGLMFLFPLSRKLFARLMQKKFKSSSNAAFYSNFPGADNKGGFSASWSSNMKQEATQKHREPEQTKKIDDIIDVTSTTVDHDDK